MSHRTEVLEVKDNEVRAKCMDCGLELSGNLVLNRYWLERPDQPPEESIDVGIIDKETAEVHSIARTRISRVPFAGSIQ